METRQTDPESGPGATPYPGFQIPAWLAVAIVLALSIFLTDFSPPETAASRSGHLDSVAP